MRSFNAVLTPLEEIDPTSLALCVGDRAQNFGLFSLFGQLAVYANVPHVCQASWARRRG